MTTRSVAAPAAGCCSPTRKRSPGSRISDVRFKQLRATGADTVVTACPFCSIMLKGAHASARGAGDVQFVDLMTYVNGRLEAATSRDADERRLARVALASASRRG